MLHLAPYITPGETYGEAKERVRRTIADYDFNQALNQFASEQGMVCTKTDLPRRVPCSSGAECTTTFASPTSPLHFGELPVLSLPRKHLHRVDVYSRRLGGVAGHLGVDARR